MLNDSSLPHFNLKYFRWDIVTGHIWFFDVKRWCKRTELLMAPGSRGRRKGLVCLWICTWGRLTEWHEWDYVDWGLLREVWKRLGEMTPEKACSQHQGTTQQQLGGPRTKNLSAPCTFQERPPRTETPGTHYCSVFRIKKATENFDEVKVEEWRGILN